MKRKLRWSLILVILAAFAVWLEPTRVVWGWLRGAAFYDGRPTSWWEAELARWHMLELGLLLDEPGRIDPHGTAFFERTRQGGFGWFYAVFGYEAEPARPIPKALLDTDGPTLLHGDLAAEPVLRVLIEHRDPHVRQLATFGWQRLEAIRLNQGRRLPTS
jgi:hypothetical protein